MKFVTEDGEEIEDPVLENVVSPQQKEQLPTMAEFRGGQYESADPVLSLRVEVEDDVPNATFEVYETDAENEVLLLAVHRFEDAEPSVQEAARDAVISRGERVLVAGESVGTRISTWMVQTEMKNGIAGVVAESNDDEAWTRTKELVQSVGVQFVEGEYDGEMPT